MTNNLTYLRLRKGKRSWTQIHGKSSLNPSQQAPCPTVIIRVFQYCSELCLSRRHESTNVNGLPFSTLHCICLSNHVREYPYLGRDYFTVGKRQRAPRTAISTERQSASNSVKSLNFKLFFFYFILNHRNASYNKLSKIPPPRRKSWCIDGESVRKTEIPEKKPHLPDQVATNHVKSRHLESNQGRIGQRPER